MSDSTSPLSREDLIKILTADRRRRVAMDARFGSRRDSSTRTPHPALEELWTRVHEEFVTLIADRLLEPDVQGPLFGRDFVRTRVATIARRLGTFQIPGSPPSYDAIVEPTVEFALSMSVLQNLQETRDRLWARVRAIYTLSQSYGISPEEFLRHPNAEDWIVRLTQTPETFRERELEWIDDHHPDIVTRRIDAFEQGIKQRLGEVPPGGFRITLAVRIPQGDRYWQYRAEYIQALEARIRLIWPGYGQEGTVETDA